MSLADTMDSQANALLDGDGLSIRAEEVRERLPTDAAHQSDLADALDRVGTAAYEAEDFARARGAFWALFLLRNDLLKADEGNREAVRDLATAEDLLGSTLLALDEIEPAGVMFRDALRLRKWLSEIDASDAHASFVYGISLWRMASLARAMDDDAAEAEALHSAMEHLEAARATFPDVPSIALQLDDVEARRREVDASVDSIPGNRSLADRIERVRLQFAGLFRSLRPTANRQTRTPSWPPIEPSA